MTMNSLVRFSLKFYRDVGYEVVETAIHTKLLACPVSSVLQLW
jgi:hypothetical protein